MNVFLLFEVVSEQTAWNSAAVLVFLGGAIWLNRSLWKLTVSVDGLRKDLRRVGRRVNRRLTRSAFIAWVRELHILNPTLKVPDLPTHDINDAPDDDNDLSDDQES